MTDGMTPQLTLPGGSSGWMLVHLCAVALAMALIARLFLWERRLVSFGVGWTLLSLRLAALAVVLVTLFKPTWAWIIDRERLGRICVGIDVSQSMQTTDRQATAAERLRWLAAIGWLNGTVPLPPPPLEPVVDQATLPATPDGLDDATWRALAERLATLTRADIARRAAFEGSSSLWDQLSKLGVTHLQVFAGSAQAATPDEMEALVNAPPASLIPESTRIETLLHAAGASDSSSPIQAIVLFTDGRDADAVTSLALAKTFGQSAIPIFPVIVGSTERPKDLSILSVDAPLAVYRGDKPRVKVLVSTSGFSGESINVTLEPDDANANAAPQTKSVLGSDEPQVVEFDVSAEALGERKYRIALPEREGETRVDNNRREFTLQVVDDRSRVLLVDHEPRWEFRYLEIAMARDERVDATVILFDQPFLGVLPDPYFRRTWPAPVAGEDDPELSDRDLVIIGDVSSSDLSETHWEHLDKFVSNQGGLLVLIAGRESMPRELNSPKLRGLLPITDPQEVIAPARLGADPRQRGWTWSLTPDGERQTSLQLATDAESNRAIWDLLPGAGWAIAGEPKPGATVWAYGRDERGGTPIPLMVHQHYGLGQVLWLATDSTWRWRFRSADQFHHRFWGQLARYAAQSKLTSGNEFVQFGPLKPRFNDGEPIELQARWSAKFLQQPLEQRAAVVEIYQGTERVAQAPLRPDPQRPLISTTIVPALPAGEYVAKLVAPQLDLGPEPLNAPFSVAAPTTAELADLSANLALLQELAAASGGKLLYPDEVAEIPRSLQPFQSVTSLPQERPLWDRWPTFCLLAGLLTTEWVIRRRNGLP